MHKETVRRVVAARLVADGYEVTEAADGEEALALARSGHPDLLILDKVMPKPFSPHELSARVRRTLGRVGP